VREWRYRRFAEVVKMKNCESQDMTATERKICDFVWKKSADIMETDYSALIIDRI
jgi:hypothetical protein